MSARTYLAQAVAAQQLGDGLARLRPACRNVELLEIARPHLAPAVTWWHVVGHADLPCLELGGCKPVNAWLTPAQVSTALVAIDMLTSSTPSRLRDWLVAHGSDPQSERAIEARELWYPYAGWVGRDEYVRAMMCYSPIGGWEYLLARTYAHPLDFGREQQEERCVAATGRTTEQLWADAAVAWATRPSIYAWPASA